MYSWTKPNNNTLVGIGYECELLWYIHALGTRHGGCGKQLGPWLWMSTRDDSNMHRKDWNLVFFARWTLSRSMSPCVDSFPNTCGSKSVSPLNYCLAGYFLCLDIFGTKTQLTSCIFLRRVETSKRRKLGPLVSGKIGASGWFGVWVLPLMHQFWIARPPVVSDGYQRAARSVTWKILWLPRRFPQGFTMNIRWYDAAESFWGENLGCCSWITSIYYHLFTFDSDPISRCLILIFPFLMVKH